MLVQLISISFVHVTDDRIDKIPILCKPRADIAVDVSRRSTKAFHNS